MCISGRRHAALIGATILVTVICAAYTVCSPAGAVPLTVSGPFLQYFNVSPSLVFGPGGESIRFGAETVLPNGNAVGGSPATTGTATMTNLTTGSTVTRTIPFDPGPDAPNFFQGSFLISGGATSNRNPANLTGPWTITFQNPDTAPASVPNILSLQGMEIPFVNSVTLSGTSANPTFSWSAPLGTTVNGYRVDIFQNNLVSNVPPLNSGVVAVVTLPPTTLSHTVTSADFTVPGFAFMPDTDYTLAIVARQTRNGAIASGNQNVNAVSFAYSSFRTLPAGAPPVNLPMVTLVGNQVIFGFSLTVAPGITYFLDPAVATGYIYQTGSGNPDFASVMLPAVQLNPFDISFSCNNTHVNDMVLPGTVFNFCSGGVGAFTVTGIDPSLALDPTNPTAFITALTFENAGNFTGTMTPITTEVSAPEPPSLTLLASALLGLGLIRRRRRAVSALQKKQADGDLDFGCELPFRPDYTDHFEGGKAGLPVFYLDGIRPI